MWIITAWQHISPDLTVKGFKSAVYPMQWMRLTMICYGMTVKRMGMFGVSVRKMKTLTEDGDSDTDW
jgi:hypothetical protein